MLRLLLVILLSLTCLGCEASPKPPTPRKPRRSQPAVVTYDFHATWCGPCLQQAPIIDGLIRDGHNVRKIDIDQEPELADKHHVLSVPTYVVLKGGKEVYRTQNANALRSYLGRAKR